MCRKTPLGVTHLLENGVYLRVGALHGYQCGKVEKFALELLVKSNEDCNNAMNTSTLLASK